MRVLVLSVAFIFAACGASLDEPSGAPAPGAEEFRADAGVVDNGEPANYCGGSHSVFLDRNGATVTKDEFVALGSDSAEIPPLTITDQQWDEVLYCVKSLVAPYDIRITETRPAMLPFTQITPTNDSTALGWPTGYRTSLLYACETDLETSDQVPFQFVFAGGELSTRQLCADIGKAIGAGYGLSTSIQSACPDVMAYDGTCTEPPVFADAPQTCGRLNAEPCLCEQANTTINSHQQMLAVAGPSDCN